MTYVFRLRMPQVRNELVLCLRHSLFGLCFHFIRSKLGANIKPAFTELSVELTGYFLILLRSVPSFDVRFSLLC